MKSISLALVCLIGLFSVNANSKTMFVLNFNRGELPDNSSACASSLSEENPAMMSVEMAQPGMICLMA